MEQLEQLDPAENIQFWGRFSCFPLIHDDLTNWFYSDLVNLSARLMQAAKGRVLVDKATKMSAQYRVAFNKLPPIEVKGKQGTIAIFEPLHIAGTVPKDRLPFLRTHRHSAANTDVSGERPQTQSVMIGRERELSELSTRLSQFCDNGFGGTVTVQIEMQRAQLCV